MIRNIPYMISAYLIGSLAKTYAAKNTAFILGIILMVFLGLQYSVSRRNNFRSKPGLKNSGEVPPHPDLALKR